MRVWAPNAQRVELALGDERIAMSAVDGGWFEHDGALDADTRYAFLLDGGAPLPDPRSARQPDGVHGPSATVDHSAFRWRHDDFTAPPLPEWRR